MINLKLVEAKKKKRKVKGTYITYTTGCPILNIRRFNQAMGTDFEDKPKEEKEAEKAAEQAAEQANDGVFDGSNATVSDTGVAEPTGDIGAAAAEAASDAGDSATGSDAGDAGASGGEGGAMGESLDLAEADELQEGNSYSEMVSKMRACDAGARKENWGACKDEKLETYRAICQDYDFKIALAQCEAEMVKRGLINPRARIALQANLSGTEMTADDISYADLKFAIDNIKAGTVDNIITSLDGVKLQSVCSAAKQAVLDILVGMGLGNNQKEVDALKQYLFDNYTIDSEELKEYMNDILTDPAFSAKLGGTISNILTEGVEKPAETNVALEEGKRIVKRYYIRPQNKFCSNKSEIIKSLIEIGEQGENCSVYSLKNLTNNEDDVHKLTPKDIIYYYDDGVLYDKNHVRVMDYDLYVKKEEERPKFTGADLDMDNPEVQDAYDDRLTIADIEPNDPDIEESLKEDLYNAELTVHDTWKVNNIEAEDEEEAEEIAQERIDNGEEDDYSEYDDGIQVEKVGEDFDEAFSLDYDSINAFGETLTEAKGGTCCICGEHYNGYGNNPDPVKQEGRCCDACNHKFVVPARMAEYQGFEPEEDEKGEDEED